MTQQELIARIGEIYAENLEIARKKNSDYADDTDAFKNLNACEMYGVPAEKGVLVRMSDKMTRISNLIGRQAAVADETVLDTLRDLSVYATLLMVLMESKQSTNHTPPPPPQSPASPTQTPQNL